MDKFTIQPNKSVKEIILIMNNEDSDTSCKFGHDYAFANEGKDDKGYYQYLVCRNCGILKHGYY